MDRRDTRVRLDVMCNQYVRDRPLIGLIVDASAHGLSVQRIPRIVEPERRVQLEFELPETGEPIWALAEICRDHFGLDGPKLVRTSGLRIVRAAARHLRMLADFVHERSTLLKLATL
jgi:hypothetical protein